MIALDWSDAAPARFVCPVCRDAREKRHVVAYEGQHVYRCDACESLSYHPFPTIDYTTHTADEVSLRDYVEMNAGVDIHCRQIDALIDRPGGSILDVGCGFGFGLDYARRQYGWRTLGYEPSSYGRAGAQQLGADIRPEFAKFNDTGTDLFDVVHCSEVLEHVEDPWEFLHLLASHLKPDGTLFLTTPNPARIVPSNSAAETLALLSPGAHTILFSVRALNCMLQLLGFRAVVINSSGPSHMVIAVRSVMKVNQNEGFDGRYRNYLAEVLRQAPAGSALHKGFAYRLYRSYCDAGEWQAAEGVFEPDLIAANPKLEDIRTYAEFADRFALCVAPMTFYRAMQTLNQKGDHLGAARLFNASRALCRKKIELAPRLSVVEENLYWLAHLHEAIALKHAGRHADAAAIADGILAEGSTAPVGIRDRAGKELRA